MDGVFLFKIEDEVRKGKDYLRDLEDEDYYWYFFENEGSDIRVCGFFIWLSSVLLR